MPLRGLTIFVIVMGIVLVVGFGVVLATVAGRLAGSGASSANPGPAFAGKPIHIPKGARVGAMTAEGNRLILRLSLPGGGQEILIINLATGAPLGMIALKPAP